MKLIEIVIFQDFDFQWFDFNGTIRIEYGNV